MRLHQQWASVRSMASPSAWLSVVGMNLARSWWRRRYIEQRANRRHAAGARADAAGPEPEDVLAVRAAVAALPSRQRAALVLRYYAGLSVDETATALGCPTGTVKSLTKRAIDGLRSSIADLHATPDADPDTDEREPIPPPPGPPALPGSGVQLAQDRLAIVTSDDRGALHAAVFDVAERRWIAAPPPTDLSHGLDGMAWDGETLALVRISDPAAEGRPSEDEPLTLRWQPGDDGWTTGSPAPLDLRSEAGAAFDGTRLALWGGTTTDLTDLDHEGPDPDARADGAIYDLATDTWETIPTGPLSARIQPAVAWSSGQLLVGGGTDRLWNPGGDLVDLAVYDPTTQSWDTRQAVPAGRADLDATPWRLHVGEREGQAQTIVATPETGDIDEPQWFYGSEGWEQAPLPTVQRLGDFWVATTPGHGNPGSGRFGLEVRAVAGRWLAAAEAPFRNRLRPTLVATGDTLVVVGGYQAPYPEPAADTWVFDLAG